MDGIAKYTVSPLFYTHFHYVHLTTCVQLEEIINQQYFHLAISPVQFHCLFYNIIPVVLATYKISCLLF